QQHEHLVAEAIVAVGRNEQPAILYEWHVGQVQGTLVLDRERQQARLVDAGARIRIPAHVPGRYLSMSASATTRPRAAADQAPLASEPAPRDPTGLTRASHAPACCGLPAACRERDVPEELLERQRAIERSLTQPNELVQPIQHPQQAC